MCWNKVQGFVVQYLPLARCRKEQQLMDASIGPTVHCLHLLLDQHFLLSALIRASLWSPMDTVLHLHARRFWSSNILGNFNMVVVKDVPGCR